MTTEAPTPDAAQESLAALDARLQAAEEAPPASQPGTALALMDMGKILDILQPRAVPLEQWLTALVSDAEFDDEEAADGGLSIITQILLADSPQAALAVTEMKNAQALGVLQPGDVSPMLRIQRAFPLPSTYEEGASTFAVIHAIDLENGINVTFTCGGRAVQAVLIKFIAQGWLPFDACLAMRRKPTAKGFYPLNLQAGA